MIIVLVLLVMLFLLPMAFFFQSTMQRRTSNANATMMLEGVLAEGAIEVIMSDMEQEIAWGSTYTVNIVTNVATGMVYTNLIYYPTSSSNMVPALAGSSGTNGLENLLKRSAYGVNFCPNGPLLAVQSSTTNSSLNGLSVSRARWNEHLLLARASTNSSTDTTPTNSFTPPDWILVARDGSNPSAWNTSLCWSATNTTTVTGRYAYAIYEEGGLLDANVAGYPAALTNQSALPVCGKGGTFFADLTQIGLDTNQINALVAWRNYASGSATGVFPDYSFSDNGTNYSLAVLGTPHGFMATYNTNTVTCTNSSGIGTDHQFVSRQELISFLKMCEPSKAASAMNALRYLGNFNRSLNQPSFAPASGRPKVGTNDDSINPAFLSVSVNSANFIRNNGSKAYVGDPLVKRRFPLSLLSWITYAGPSATATNTWAPYLAAGIPQSLLSVGSTNNIQGYFGLNWNSSDGSWTYQSGSNQPIMTLSQVSAAGRDPNFFEMLKAAITFGSLGKAYTSTGAASNSAAWSTPIGYNEVYDNWTDAQIIQIGANIIGQSRCDNYPTRIQFSDGTTFGGASVEIRSVQDLPYLYRVREGKIMTQDSSPSISKLPMIGGSVTNAGSGVVLQEPEIWNPHAMRTNVTTNPGPTSFRLLAITTDPLSAATNGNTPTATYSIGAVWVPQSGTNITWQTNTATNLNTNNSLLKFSIPLTRQDLFREPTLLIKPNIPSGSSLSAPATNTLITNASAYQYAAIGVSELSTTTNKYIGIPMGTVPMAFAGTFAKNGIISGIPNANNGASGIAPAGYVTYGSGGAPNVTYLLQCQDYYGNWITYDEKYASVANATNGYVAPTCTNTNTADFTYNQNKTFYTDSNNTTWSKNAIGSEWSVVAFDPRSSRFGMNFAGCNGGGSSGYSLPLGAALGLYAKIYAPLYSAGWAAPIGSSINPTIKNAAQQNAVLTSRPDEYSGMVLSSLNTGPTSSGWSPGGSSSIVRPGMIAQNNPNVTSTATKQYSSDLTSLAFVNQYFADDDGVVRRGMSAYVPFSSSIPATTTTPSSSYPSGLPLLPAYQFDSSGNATAITASLSANANEYLGRPVMLNRPFRSVQELGTVFSGTPWRNLDCSTPESGAAALMDVFCINDTTDTLALVAGRVNLNTRQVPVLQAILSGAYKEEFNPSNSLVNSLISTNLANAAAQALVNRTLSTAAPAGPLVNISDLVGKWYTTNTVGSSFVNGSLSYAGFSDDSTSTTSNDLTAIMTNTSLATDPELRVQRLRDATLRALSSSGQTRVWNVMIDLVVQTGRYPSTATGLNNFMVDGQVHNWIHLAIDRLTGQLLDRRVETVKE